MPRRPLVIAILAVLAAAALSVPLVLVFVVDRPAADAPSPTASAEPRAAEPLRPDEIGWVFAAALFEGPAETYSLQAGTLGEPAPILDLQVPFGVDANVAAWRRPAFGPVIDGTVVYVADDGAQTSVLRSTIEPNPAVQQLAALDEIVYSIAVAPDGKHAYLALGDRADHELDRGIVRVSLDGQGRQERIFDPAPGANHESVFSLAAVVGFHVDISMSMDGRHLIRYACAGLAGCGQQVIDLETGAVTPFGERRVLGVAGGIVLVQQCLAECFFELIDLASGAVHRLPGKQWDATITLVGDRPRVVVVDDTQPDGAVLRAFDPADGAAREIFRAPPGKMVTLSAVSPDMRIGLPEGYLLVSLEAAEIGAIVESRAIAVPLDGGQPVDISLPAFRPEFHGVQG